MHRSLTTHLSPGLHSRWCMLLCMCARVLCIMHHREVWMPWLLLASNSIWANESIAYVRDLHPTWNRTDIEAEAVRTWNISATAFMVATLKKCVELRPHAAWGYYGRPGCYSGLDTGSPTPRCIDSVQSRNDALGELWAAGTALYPSVYIGPDHKVQCTHVCCRCCCCCASDDVANNFARPVCFWSIDPIGSSQLLMYVDPRTL